MYKLGDGLTGKVAKDGKPIIRYDIRHDPEADSEIFLEQTSSPHSGFIAVAIRNREGTITHVLRCINKEYHNRVLSTFSTYDLKLMLFISEIVGVYLENQRIIDEKGEFVTNIRHETLAPINAIWGATEYLIDNYDNPSIEKKNKLKAIKTIDTECLLLSNVLGGLDVEKLTVQDLIFQPVDLWKDVLELAIFHFERFPLYSNKRYSKQGDKKLRLLYPDKERLIQVVVNLLVNASKYSDKTSNVEIKVRDNDPDYVIVDFSNYGLEIPQGWEDKIFDKFTRTPEARNVNPSGMGYGLYISKKLIELMDGKLELTSRGNPVTFSLYISTIPRG